MARQKTPQETTVRVETVGVEEIAQASAKATAAEISPRLKAMDDKISHVHRSARTNDGRLFKRLGRAEKEIRDLNQDIDTLFKMVSGQNTGVTVTRHSDRASRTR